MRRVYHIKHRVEDFNERSKGKRILTIIDTV